MYMSQSKIETPATAFAELGGDGTAGECRPEKQLKLHEGLFCEGDNAGFIYEVAEGVMCNYRMLADGRRQVLSFAYPGDLVGFGHTATYRFNCDAICSVRVSCIPMAAVMRGAQERANVGRRLLEVVSTELAHMQELQLLLGRKSAIEKVATFLLMLARRNDESADRAHQFQFPMTRTDIADFLGMTIETVSRNMTKLKDMGVIDLPQSSTVVVRDIDKLEDLANGEDAVV